MSSVLSPSERFVLEWLWFFVFVSVASLSVWEDTELHGEGGNLGMVYGVEQSPCSG